MSELEKFPDGLGAHIRQERESLGLTLEEISHRTKMSMMILRAIESDDFLNLPSGIFGRSFIQMYAQEIGLDPELAVRQFRAMLEDKKLGDDETAVTDIKWITETSEGRSQLLIAGKVSIVLLALISALLLYNC